MTPVALLRENDDIYQVGDPSSEPEPQPPDPVTDLVAENEIAFVERAGPPAGILFLLQNLREPGREILVLFHVSNRQLAHLAPSGWETPLPT